MKKNVTFVFFSLFFMLSSQTYCQKFVIKGQTIFDGDEKPAIGTTILVEGTTKGTITDLDGYFRLELEQGEHILVFGYTKHKDQRIKVNLFAHGDLGEIRIYKRKKQRLRTVTFDGASVASLPDVNIYRLPEKKSRLDHWGKTFNKESKIKQKAKPCLVFESGAQKYVRGWFDGKVVDGYASGKGNAFILGLGAGDARIESKFKKGKATGNTVYYGFVEVDNKEIPMIANSIYKNGLMDGETIIEHKESFRLHGKEVTYLVFTIKNNRIQGRQYFYDANSKIQFIYECDERGNCETLGSNRYTSADEKIVRAIVAVAAGVIVKGVIDLPKTLREQRASSNNGAYYDEEPIAENDNKSKKKEEDDCFERYQKGLKFDRERSDVLWGKCKPCKEYRIPPKWILGSSSTIYLIETSEGEWYHGYDFSWSGNEKGPFKSMEEAINDLCN